MNEDFRVLTLATVFPNPAEPDFGLFIHRRMKEVSQTVPVTVIAPVAVVEYGNPNRKIPDLSKIPARRTEGGLDIYHPRWFYPPLGGFLNAAFLWSQHVWMAKRMRFDLIDAHFAHPEGVAAALLASSTGKPFIVTLRGSETDHAVYPRRLQAMAWALKRAARVVTVSERLREWAIEQGCDPARVVKIPNGINGQNFYPRDRAAARQEFGMAPDAKIILSAGYLIERKGHHRVAEALRGVLDSGQKAELWIAGGPGREGDFEDEIKKTVATLGLQNEVKFLGAVKPDALAKLMSACDVFCLATSNEGWPNVVHEAMACGAPVVATDIGAIPEMIQSDEFGYVVPFGDREALTARLGQALARDWDRAAISRWALGRSWENVAAEVIQLMKDVVREVKRP